SCLVERQLVQAGRGLIGEQELDAVHRGQGGVGLAPAEVGWRRPLGNSIESWTSASPCRPGAWRRSPGAASTPPAAWFRYPEPSTRPSLEATWTASTPADTAADPAGNGDRARKVVGAPGTARSYKLSVSDPPLTP